MPASIRHVTVDCADPYRLAGFWSEVTGWPLSDDDHPGDPEALLRPPAGTGIAGLLFIRVPESKAVKNRIHFDLDPGDNPRDVEVGRLLGLGATRVADHILPDGRGWVVLSDPEGNEFCVERSQAEQVSYRALQAQL